MPEVEPNDSRDTAPLISGRQFSIEAGSMGTDVDCFGVRAAAGGSLVAYTHDGNGACPTDRRGPANTLITVVDSVLTVVAQNDDAIGHGRCSRIDGPTLGTGFVLPAAGDYRVCVSSGGGANIERYVLSVLLLP